MGGIPFAAFTFEGEEVEAVAVREVAVGADRLDVFVGERGEFFSGYHGGAWGWMVEWEWDEERRTRKARGSWSRCTCGRELPWSTDVLCKRSSELLEGAREGRLKRGRHNAGSRFARRVVGIVVG